jgi:hypothetical protein
MAITTNAIASSFKKELLEGKHDFSTASTGKCKFKLAMYNSNAVLGKSTTSYTTGSVKLLHQQVILQVVKH